MNIDKTAEARPASEPAAGSRAGLTLVEVCISMALTALMCAGLYAVGLKARQFTEENRLATEARALAKQRLEEMVSLGLVNLAQPSCMLLNGSTHTSTLGYPIVRQPRVAWHAADRSVVGYTNAVYAEVHVDVTYESAMTDGQITDSYSTIIE